MSTHSDRGLTSLMEDSMRKQHSHSQHCQIPPSGIKPVTLSSPGQHTTRQATEVELTKVIKPIASIL